MSPKDAAFPGRTRRWFTGAVWGSVAAVATVGGVAVAWRRSGRPPDASPGGVSQTGGVLQVPGLWLLKFDTPDGASLSLASLRGKPLLLNFWATWCPPCVEELPLINGFFQQNRSKGWQVLGIAVDQLGPVKTFLSKMPLNFPVALAGLPGIDLSKSLGNLSGALPFTVVFAADGRVVQRKMGRITAQDLSAWAGQG